jgi:hypothetical protein
LPENTAYGNTVRIEINITIYSEIFLFLVRRRYVTRINGVIMAVTFDWSASIMKSSSKTLNKIKRNDKLPLDPETNLKKTIKELTVNNNSKVSESLIHEFPITTDGKVEKIHKVKIVINLLPPCFMFR